jgi:hypothetical protein
MRFNYSWLTGIAAIIGLISLTACGSHAQGDTAHPRALSHTDSIDDTNSKAKPVLPKDRPALSWVQNADPLNDAEQAITVNDLRLLAFAGRVISLPGVDLTKHSIEELQQHCGYRTLKGTGDTLRVGKSTSLRSQAYDYAVIYNQKVLASCL